jgi:hypothetical protein
MVSLLGLLLHVLASPFRSQARLEAEIVFLRHQLNLLRRRLPAKPRLTPVDRLLFVWLYRLVPPLSAAVIIQPETIVRWHRAGVRWKSLSLGGRPKVPAEVRSLIRRMSVENPLWGAPRVHGELLKLGIEVAQSTVAKYMAKRRPGSGRRGRRSRATIRRDPQPYGGNRRYGLSCGADNQLSSAVRLGHPTT